MFAPGTPIGLHLRVHRLVLQEADRHVYLVNDTDPRWHTKKCWDCGFRYSPPTAQSCSYCATPFDRDCSSWWLAGTHSATRPFCRSLDDVCSIPGLQPPPLVFHYHRQLLSVYSWDHEQLLCEQPAPIDERTLLPAMFCLADGLSIHSHGVVLKHLNARHVLTNAKGEHQLFDLEVAKLLTDLWSPRKIPTLPPLRDIRNLCASSAPTATPMTKNSNGSYNWLAEANGRPPTPRRRDGIVRPAYGAHHAYVHTTPLPSGRSKCRRGTPEPTGRCAP